MIGTGSDRWLWTSLCAAGVGERCGSDLQLHRDWFRLPLGHVQLQLLQQQRSEVMSQNPVTLNFPP